MAIDGEQLGSIVHSNVCGKPNHNSNNWFWIVLSLLALTCLALIHVHVIITTVIIFEKITRLHL